MTISSPILAFVAGILSILSPCVLPILPIVLGTAASTHRRGPLALAAGLSLSFVAIGLFLATAGHSVGLDADRLRYVAAALIVVVGVYCCFHPSSPPCRRRRSHWKLGRRQARNKQNQRPRGTVFDRRAPGCGMESLRRTYARSRIAARCTRKGPRSGCANDARVRYWSGTSTPGSGMAFEGDDGALARHLVVGRQRPEIRARSFVRDHWRAHHIRGGQAAGSISRGRIAAMAHQYYDLVLAAVFTRLIRQPVSLRLRSP